MRTTTETDRLGDEIAELAAHLDAATHRLLTLIRRFDEAGGWADQGALSCAHWLSWRIGLDLGAAREHVRVARSLADLPHVDVALSRGRISYSKVRAITRVATPATEASLLEMARSSTASQLERICRGYRLAMRNVSNECPEDEPDRRWVRERETDEGLVRFDVQLRPDEAAIVRRALEAAMERAWDASAETPPSCGRARRRRRTVPRGWREGDCAADRGRRPPRRSHARRAGRSWYAGRWHRARADDDGAARLRCERRGGRRRFPRKRSRCRPPPADDPDAAASSAPASGSRLPLSGVHESTRRRPPRRTVGTRRRDDAREPLLALPAASHPRPRVRVPHGERRRGRISVLPAGRAGGDGGRRLADAVRDSGGRAAGAASVGGDRDRRVDRVFALGRSSGGL